MDKSNLSEKIKNRAIASGYDLCGIIPATPFYEFEQYLNKRIQDFPESKSQYEGLQNLACPAETAKSIIVCIRKYSHYKKPEYFDGKIGKVYLFDGRLAYSKEYRAACEVSSFLDSLNIEYRRDSITARWAAEKAGLGLFGRNNFIYTKFGSYVWIDTWQVDVELNYDKTEEGAGIECLCRDDCRKCIEACPTKALSGDYSMDKGKCVAGLSFGYGEIDDKSLWDKMGTWIYGCDVCQDVCPMNKNKLEQTAEFPLMEKTNGEITLEKLFMMDEEYFLKIVQPRFWYIGEADMYIWKCSALRAMANSGDPQYHALLWEACESEDERIRETALWACSKLNI